MVSVLSQILRWNWSLVVLAMSFARSTAAMAFALRFSVLPLIDSIMHLAFNLGVECDLHFKPQQAFDLQRSAIKLSRFTLTKYFETELQRCKPPEPRTRKAPDS
jgi:hypothetical protein